MEEIKVGMLARSKAGHDKGTVYMIIAADETYAYLADGKTRTKEKPKKKKHFHIQPMAAAFTPDHMTDVEIKRALKLYRIGE